jgi:uncharacterized protein
MVEGREVARIASPAARRRLSFALVVVAAAAALWAPKTAGAAPTELFLSEYVEGTGNNRALELYNGSGTPVDLSAGGYNVRLYTNGSTSPGFTVFLAGTVSPRDVFVLASSFADPAIRAQANQLTTSFPLSGDDTVVLRKGAQVIDSMGQVGYDPGTEWGAGMTSTMDNTLRRKRSVEAGDTNPMDVFDPATEWDGLPMDTFDGLGWYSLCDTNSPTVAVVAVPGTLRPPNHKRVAVEALVTAQDDTDPAPVIQLVSVTSSEPDDARGSGDGHTTGDITVVDGNSFLLRAERSVKGPGRVYTLTYRATDACENAATASATVQVPLNPQA